MSETVSLDGSWSLIGPRNINVPAIVPGCAHADLIREGAIPDPYYRDNEEGAMWVGESDWTYERSFDVPASLLERDSVVLRFQGLDTLAEIVLNDKELAKTDNMFRVWELDVKALLRAGENRISVTFLSPVKYAEKKQKERFLWHTGLGHHRLNGGNWLRKEQSNFGWDWGPLLATSGIWRSVDIHGFDTAEIEDVSARQDHARGRVELEIAATLRIARRSALSALVNVSRNGEVVASAKAPVARGKASAKLSIRKPALWWPNTMGEQPLYTVTVVLLGEGGEVLDTQSRRIGLRRMELVRENDQWGQSFYFRVNGRRFFAKGANWIPADQFDVNATDARHRALLQAAKDANMNMIRVWGGGKYERDDFYDACDELGLCVWQDFMFACSAYPADDDSFMENVKVEATQNVRRLRHHPSLAIWCGNNELEHINRIIGDGADQMTWDDYKKLFDVALAKIVEKEDPQTVYWPSSEHTPVGDRLDAANPDSGDAHLWKVWHAREPFEWYRTSFHRFCSEFGFQSFPEPRTIETYTLPEERNVTSYVMERHQRSPIGNSAIIDYMLSWFRLPVGYENTVWLSQILQSLAIKYAVEHWRQNKPRCMGALYWQLNDCWQVASWSSVDYFLRWKALHYAARRFFDPILVSGVEDKDANTIVAHVTSDLDKPFAAELSWLVVDASGAQLDSGYKTLKIAADSAKAVATLDLAKVVAQVGQRAVLVKLYLKNGSELLSENLVTLARPKHLELRDPKLKVTAKPVAGGAFDVTVKAAAPALWTWLELKGADATYSDNFLHLLRGESATVRVTPAERIGMADFKARLAAKSLFDTYQER